MKRRLIAFILAALLTLGLAALAEEETLLILKGDDVPALPEPVAKQIGDIPDTPEALLARSDVAEMDALLRQWDAEAMVRDLREAGAHACPDMGCAWETCMADGETLQMEQSDGQITVTVTGKTAFEDLELERASDDENTSLYLATYINKTTGEILRKHAIMIAGFDDDQYGFFYYTLDLYPDGCELFVDAGEDTIRECWQVLYDAQGNVIEKTYVREDVSNL